MQDSNNTIQNTRTTNYYSRDYIVLKIVPL